jgi:hypothetical protein
LVGKLEVGWLMLRGCGQETVPNPFEADTCPVTPLHDRAVISPEAQLPGTNTS